MVPFTPCQRCQVLPDPPKGPGVLHLRFPLSHSQGKIAACLKAQGLSFEVGAGTISVIVAQGDLAPLLAPLAATLTGTERHDVRVLFQRGEQPMLLQDYFDVTSLDEFLAQIQSGWLTSMIAEQRLTTVFQPILNCKTQEVFAYECLMRGEDNGQTVYPGRILEIAKGAGLLFQVDLAARQANIREAARFALITKIFINFTPTSIYDPINCLRSTVEAIDRLGLQRQQVVFEVIESEQVRDIADLNKILNYYRDNGFQVALDDVGAGYSSLNMIAHLRPDYIKLDRELLSNVHKDPFKATIARKLLESAQELSMKTVAEGIEEIGEFEWLLQQGADFVQGYLFARPASPPPLPKLHP